MDNNLKRKGVVHLPAPPTNQVSLTNQVPPTTDNPALDTSLVLD
jgi:hypothetical protein